MKNDILNEVPNEWEKYETIIGNKFELTGIKLMKLLKYGKISFLRNPKALFKSGRSIRFQFDMFHGNGVLDKAIDVLDEKERDDFRKFVIEKILTIKEICLFVNHKILWMNITEQYLGGLKN